MNNTVVVEMFLKATTPFPTLFLNPYPTANFSTSPNSKHLQKTNVAEKICVIFERSENIAGNGEIAPYQHFLFFPKYFQKPLW